MPIINVVQGECHVCRIDDHVLTTVLGSCIAACLYDLGAAVGGMNHFLLPESKEGTHHNVKYGAFLMEFLVNELLKVGASKSQLRAQLFGGSNMNLAFGGVGERNIIFARRYLAEEGIPLDFECVGGSRARRINFQPTVGLVDVKIVSKNTGVNESIPCESSSQQSKVTLF